MRKRIWITGTVAILVCLLALLIKRPWQTQTNVPEQGDTTVVQPAPTEKSKVTNSHQPSKVSPASDGSAVEASSTNAIRPDATEANVVDPGLLAAWQGNIEFYGKVIDENSNAVAGANIAFRWVETPTVEGNRATNAQSDAEGMFTLQGQHGLNLNVSVTKNGYYSSHRDNDSFSYGSLNGTKFSPDPQNPVIFSLRKKNPGELLTALKRNYRVSRDGTPISIDLLTGANTSEPNGNFVVQCWTNDQDKRSGEKYDWQCVVAIPGGGMVTTDEEYPFLAPENNYRPKLEIKMPSDSTNWSSQVDLKFYYRLADGRYGRMTFSIVAGGQHFCMIDSLLNTFGSRNLEPK